MIDDLELWSGKDCGLAENADALREAMDTLGSRLFFVVSTSHWTIAHLDQATDIAGAFQVQIHMDQTPVEDFVQTVITRHAATHLRVVDAQGREMDTAALSRHAERIFRQAKGNMGDGLRRWARSMRLIDTSTVQAERLPNYLLPDFIDAENGVLLADIKRQRYSNEYDLRRRFGPAFDKQFRPVVQRLVGLEVLQRHRSGTLAVNPVISNEVALLLQRRGFLQAHSPGKLLQV